MNKTRKSVVSKRDDHDRDPHRKPAWRWLRATELLAQDRHSVPIQEDQRIGEALAFLRTIGPAATDGERPAIQALMPSLAAAHAIYAADGVARHEIEARLLAAETFPVIAVKSGVSADTVAAFETFFFNVGDRLEATDWLLSKAVGIHPAMRRPLTERDIWCYCSAVTDGSRSVDLLVADRLGRHEPEIPDRHLLAEKARFLVRDYVTDWSSPEAAAAIIEEGCRLFLPSLTPALAQREREMFEVQLRFLRSAYGMDSKPAAPRRRRTQGRPPAKAKIQRQAPKEVSHDQG